MHISLLFNPRIMIQEKKNVKYSGKAKGLSWKNSAKNLLNTSYVADILWNKQQLILDWK